MNIWKPVDALGAWLLARLSVVVQTRIGVLCTLGSFPFLLAVFFVSEPPLIFEMSALALLLTGLGIIVAAAPSVKKEDT